MELKRLRLLTKLTSVALLGALTAFALPFVLSLKPSSRADANQFRLVDVSDMQPGSSKDVGSYRIYRRTDRDFTSYEHSKLHHYANLLSAPLPIGADEFLRSAHREFFVFFPYSVRRGCELLFIDSKDEDPWNDVQIAFEKIYPRFHDPCEGRVFDTTGRALGEHFHPPEADINVPSTSVVDGGGRLYLNVQIIER